MAKKKNPIIEENTSEIIKNEFKVTVANCELLNVRDSENGTIIATKIKGSVMLATECENPDWYKVEYDSGKVGYCKKKFLKVL